MRIAMKRGKFHHQEALDERPQGWAGGLLKKLHHGARVRLHAFIRMREVSARNSRSSAARRSFGSVSGCALWSSGRATVHDNLGSGHVRSIIRRQVQNGFSYLIGFAKATERNSSHDPLF